MRKIKPVRWTPPSPGCFSSGQIDFVFPSNVHTFPFGNRSHEGKASLLLKYHWAAAGGYTQRGLCLSADVLTAHPSTLKLMHQGTFETSYHIYILWEACLPCVRKTRSLCIFFPKNDFHTQPHYMVKCICLHPCSQLCVPLILSWFSLFGAWPLSTNEGKC